MTLIYEEEVSTDFDFDPQELAKSVINQAIEQENFPYEAQVSLTITDNNGIQEINNEFREIDSPTDVLSFPLIDFKFPADFDIIDRSDCYTDMDSGEVVLGDIVLNIDRIKSQAMDYNHSIRREFAFLIAHSMMHLMGYDHMTEDEEKIMFAKQESVLTSLNILRNL